LFYPAMYRERHHRRPDGFFSLFFLSFSSFQHAPGQSNNTEGTDEAPHLARHSFVSLAIKKGMVHDTVIRLAPVEEEEARKFAPLRKRANCGVKSEERISSPTPASETVSLMALWDMRNTCHHLHQQVGEQLFDTGEERQAMTVGAVG
jgi:hypothetical protein